MGIQRKIRILSLFANIGVAEARLNEIDRGEVVIANELVKYKKRVCYGLMTHPLFLYSRDSFNQ